MTADNQLPEHLEQLGQALDRATRADLSGRSRALRRLRHPRRVVAGVALTAIVVPAAAIAATQLISTGEVAASLPQGTLALMGTHPTCTVVTANVEYHCVLASAPSNDGAPETASGAPSLTSLKTTSDTTAVMKLTNGKTYYVKADSPSELKQEMGEIVKKSNAAVASTNTLTQPATTDWKGTVEPTVDATKHVNGGCRALNSAGTDWECYVGDAAVQQSIISQGFLGQYAPSPGVG